MDNLSPKQIQQMISMLQQMLPEDDETEKTEEAEVYNPIKTKTSRGGRRNFENKFESMQERNMHKSDNEIDKKLTRFNPTPRRDPVDLIKIRCRICGKEEEVSPALVAEADRYKCNRCSISSG